MYVIYEAPAVNLVLVTKRSVQLMLGIAQLQGSGNAGTSPQSLHRNNESLVGGEISHGKDEKF